MQKYILNFFKQYTFLSLTHSKLLLAHHKPNLYDQVILYLYYHVSPCSEKYELSKACLGFNSSKRANACSKLK